MEILQSKELRIGNYVNSNVNGISKVEQAGSSLNKDYIGSVSLHGHHWTNSCVPIPLDCELLVLFGFEYAGNLFDCDFYKKDKYVVSVIKGEFKFSLKEDPKSKYIHLKEIKHVHQLQNIYFALTGEELTL